MTSTSETGTKTKLIKAEAKLADAELKEELTALIQKARDDMAADLTAAEDRMRSLAWKVVLAVGAISGGGVGADFLMP